jgi:ubiquitin carboxyl-terminal hydrolase 4/11/15
VRETDGSRVVTPAAYLLFYRRRSVKPLGGPHYERIITAANSKPDANHDSDPDDDGAEAEASSGPEHNASREPSPPRGILIGPALPTVLGYAGSVGNSTLWGESMPLKSKGDELPSYEEAVENATFDFDDTSVGGVAVNESLDVQDSTVNVVSLVPASDVEEDEKVEEVRVGDEEERL